MYYMKKSYKLYYILGSIIVGLCIAIILVASVLPFAIRDILEEHIYISWILVIIDVLGFIGSFFGIYLLKKGNFLRLNEKIKEKDKN